MKCPGCGHANPERAKFCLECGSAMLARCARCATELPAGAKFCLECGNAVAGTAAAPVPRSFAEPAPASYTPRHLADRILQSRAALEGERKQVTVLFADVKGSMALAEQLDPEEWHRILERFFAILTEGVHRFEGTVNQYTGDGIMALFGAPIAHEDHAQRACYAALSLRDELRAHADSVRIAHGLNFTVRMGINSGEVVVGRIGDDLRMDYTAQGHTVGLAQRMEALAEAGKAMLAGATIDLVQGYFALRDLGTMTVKGIEQPVRVAELEGVGEARNRFDISRARGLSPFVGRTADMRTLEAALEQVQAGQGQVVGIVADAGTGKSRLCFEFLERCRARGARVLIGRAVAHGKDIPYLPILDILRAYFDIGAGDGDQAAREKIAGRMVLLDPALTETLPSLFEFLGVGVPGRPAAAVESRARQQQIVGVLRALVQGDARPTVIMIEDLHWLDPASDELLAHIVDARSSGGSLLVLNFRPGYQAGWMQKSWYRQIPLNPLSTEEIRLLVADALGRDASLAGLPDVIAARVAGNPFFAEEIVQSLIESRQLLGARGAWRLVKPLTHLEIPPTVQAVLAARIDRLAEREKRLLQAAAVIGKEFPERLLSAVEPSPEGEVTATLANLQGAEFIYQKAIFPALEYSFRHPLTQEVALGSLLRDRRRLLHAAVARALEAEGGNRDEQAPLLAHHWEQAGEPGPAVRAHARAAAWAGMADPVQGLRHWMKVRDLGRPLEDAEARELRLQACKAILGGATFRFDLGPRELRACMDEARHLTESLQLAPSAMAPAIAGLAIDEGVHGRGAAALALATEALALIQPGMALVDELTVRMIHGWTQSQTGCLADAVGTFDASLGLTGGDIRLVTANGQNAVAYAEFMAAHCLAALGRFEACWPRLLRGIDAAREANSADDIVFSINQFAMSAFLAGGAQGHGLPDLLQRSQACVAAADPENLNTSMLAQLVLGTALLLAGDARVADAVLSAGLSRVQSAGTALEWSAFYWAVNADACRALGDLERACAHARSGIDVGDRGGFRFQAALCRAALADAMQQAQAPADEVARMVADARALADATGGRSLLPRLRETEARCHARGEPRLLLPGLREAEAMYRAMGALGHAYRLAREIAS